MDGLSLKKLSAEFLFDKTFWSLNCVKSNQAPTLFLRLWSDAPPIITIRHSLLIKHLIDILNIFKIVESGSSQKKKEHRVGLDFFTKFEGAGQFIIWDFLLGFSGR